MSDSETGAPASGAKKQLGHASSLLDALDAVSRWQPFALLAATFLAALLLAALFGAVGASFGFGVMTAITGLIGFVAVAGVATIGLNAAGIWLSDQVWGRPQRSMGQSLLTALLTVHRLLAVLLIEFLLFMAFMLVLALVFFVCKIPGIGPLLYAFAMPIGVIASGVVLFALTYIAGPLVFPAIWNGTPVLRTVVMLLAVARSRMAKAVVMMVLLGLMISLVVFFIWSMLALGALVVTGLSAMTIGTGNLFNLSTLFGIFSSYGGYGGGGGGGYGYAIAFGSAVIALVAAIPAALIALKGFSIIYREVSEGLALDEGEKNLSGRMADLKSRAQAAHQTALAYTHTSGANHSGPRPPGAPSALACPACQAQITPQDLFCGSCGHKLQ